LTNALGSATTVAVKRPRLLVRFAWLALTVAVPGCDKPNDQPVLQQEALSAAKDYDHRLDELQERFLKLRVAADRRALMVVLNNWRLTNSGGCTMCVPV